MTRAFVLAAAAVVLWVPEAGARHAPAAAGSGDEPGWTVTVSVEDATVGPIVVSAGELRTAPKTDARPWLRHDLVFRNRGDRPVRFADTRQSAFLGPPGRRALLAADDGCGYGRNHPRAPVEAGVCLTYLDAFVVEPGASVRRTVTLFKELPGMARLASGTYTFERPIRFDAGRGLPGAGATSATLRLVYAVGP